MQTAFGLAVSDAFYADVLDDDGRPELAVGRLPALSAADLAAIVAKIVAFETAPATPWGQDLALLADSPDDGGDFTTDSDAMGAVLPAGRTVARIYADELGYDLARTSLREAFAEGTRVISYLGHGGFDRLSREGLLTSAQVAEMANAERLPILFAGTCVAGEAGQPGKDCLAETLIRHTGGGCVAVWAPSTLAHNAQSRVLGARFLSALFDPANPRLGDAMLAAVREFLLAEPDTETARQAAAAYNLLGDPATVPGLGRR
ncbi:MAG: Peptidase family C25 [Lentisphaerae bacterium ADurb.BinA184]|nr:MAG: Peptidase family C25 [Lentisphaerae bacterium ADurb.BinA184]